MPSWALHRADHSLLVQVFLWENDADAAWREACAGGCSEALWLQLAATREQSHPRDALAIHRRQIEPALARTNDEAYRQAIGHLRKMRELMRRLGEEAGFAGYLADIRASYKRKRNFIAMLDRERW